MLIFVIVFSLYENYKHITTYDLDINFIRLFKLHQLYTVYLYVLTCA